MTTVPLACLHPGHEAEPPINARKSMRDAEIESLAAMIAAQGLINALQVIQSGAVYYVAAGNRRLLALRYLRDNAIVGFDGTTITDETPIRVEIIRDGLDPLEISQAENVAHLPPHEADQLETFARLAETLSAEQIAGRFGIEPKRVQRILALGTLSPVILDAWRDGTIEPTHSRRVVRAFTLASREDQERVYAKLHKTDDLTGWNVEQELGLNKTAATGKLVSFVGRDAYIAAGGEIREDLFGDHHIVSDPVLAKRLADEKLAAKAAELIEQGWSWAASYADLPEQAHYSWRQVTTKSTASAKDKAISGCILSIGSGGELEVKYGVLKPEAERAIRKAEKAAEAKTGGKGAATEAPAAPISAALVERLTTQITVAVQRSFGEQPMVALAALGAGILSRGGWSQPMHLRMEGLEHDARPEAEAFADAFDRLYHLEPGELLRTLAHLAAQAVHMVSHNPLNPIGEQHLALIDALEPVGYHAHLRQIFDLADYLKSAPKHLVLRAIAEAVSPDEAAKLAGKPKAAAVEFGLANIKAGEPGAWLPPELRGKHYDGPRDAPKPAAKPVKLKLAKTGAKKAAAKKASRKPAPKQAEEEREVA